MIENEKDKKIIQEILEKLNETYIEHKYFTDGADSRVILLNNKYLIKQNINYENIVKHNIFLFIFNKF